MAKTGKGKKDQVFTSHSIQIPIAKSGSRDSMNLKSICGICIAMNGNLGCGTLAQDCEKKLFRDKRIRNSHFTTFSKRSGCIYQKNIPQYNATNDPPDCDSLPKHGKKKIDSRTEGSGIHISQHSTSPLVVNSKRILRDTLSRTGTQSVFLYRRIVKRNWIHEQKD